jgi:tetratricopeptide (TPR) repeat protein
MRATLRLLIAGALTVAASLAIWLLFPAYRSWALQRAANAAVFNLANSNYVQASLSARRALQINSNCVAACRVMAQLDESLSSPRALYWRQRVVQLEPNVDSNHLDLARSALAFARPTLARQAIRVVSERGKATNAQYHALQAQLAFASRDLRITEQHLEQAAGLEPTNPVHWYNLQITRLHSPDPAVAHDARTRLDSKRDDPVHGTAILRALIREALAHSDLDRAYSRSLQLQSRSDRDFDDRLMHLSILRTLPPQRSYASPSITTSTAPASPDLEFHELLAQCETEAGTDPDRIAALAAWLAGHGSADLALAWVESFPDDVHNATAVRLAEAECYVARKAWPELASLLEQSHWGADDHLRHATMALAYRQQGEKQLSDIEWKRAVRAANEGVQANSKSRQALVRLAGAWAWENESEQLLWDIVRQGRDAQWALAVLRQAYEIGGDTRSLLRVFDTMLRTDPQDSSARNNVAAASLLLGTNLPAAHQLAREAYAAQPTNPAVACTYAYSLHLQGRTAEGLEAMSRLPQPMVQNPSTAAYYGVLLSADGAKTEAEKYFAFARSGFLLPEERALVDHSAAKPRAAAEAAGPGR